MSTITQFRPALLFLGKFLLLYFFGNIVYGAFIEWCNPLPDPITRCVTVQTGFLLEKIGFENQVMDNPIRPTVFVKSDGATVISVFEGCNGINVMIVFVAFVIAVGGSWRSMLWFLPVGILAIHLINLLRVGLLYYTARFQPEYFYYFHKYVFTGILYIIVFLGWWLWILKNKKQHAADPAQ